MVKGKTSNISDAFVIKRAVDAWITGEQVRPERDAEYRFLDANTRLSSREKKAIKLCKQLNIKDDKETRKASKMLNITPIGIYSIIIKVYRQGAISRNEEIQILD